MKRIPLTQGMVAIVDDDVFEWASKWKWRVQAKRYAVRHNPANRSGCIYLHRAIMEPPAGYEVDHINGDGFDCRRANMRLATHGQNIANQRRQLRRAAKGQYKGVHFVQMSHKDRNPRSRPWAALIKTQHLGYFSTAEAAARAYDAHAKRIFGEFANLNFP